MGIVAAITSAAVVATLTACGGTSHTRRTTSRSAPMSAVAAEVASLLAGIPQRGNTLGYPKAPVIVQYFADLQCPFCKRFTLGTLPSLIRKYVRDGRLKIEYRSLETATRDPETFEAQQVAALAAGEQDKMWNYLDLFYHEQGREDSGYVTERYLQGLAEQVSGLDLVAWIAARSDTRLANTLTGDARAASHAGLTSTPTFLIGTIGNPPYVSAIRRELVQGLGANRSSR